MAWDPSLFGITVLAEFVQRTMIAADSPDWTADYADHAAGPGQDRGTVRYGQELADLVKLVEYRPEVMSEALAQATDMVGYWAGLLMFSRFSHPWTFRLARIAIVVGEFVAMKLKRANQRPRPSQLSPALMPPIAVPGHASYPSGHATQAYLLSALMATGDAGGRQRRCWAPSVAPPTPPILLAIGPARMLNRLAERVARNREVMGLHYRSDSEAGKNVAAQILPLLLACPRWLAPLASQRHHRQGSSGMVMIRRVPLEPTAPRNQE